MLFLRPCYFLVAALLGSLGAMNSALAVILILIGSKLVLGLCGVQVPLWVFITLLTASRIFFGVRACLRERWADAAAI
jgi:predicted tellurium resistance membrane protein TerC